MLASIIATWARNASSSKLSLTPDESGTIVLTAGAQYDQADIQAGIPWCKNRAKPCGVAIEEYPPMAWARSSS